LLISKTKTIDIRKFTERNLKWGLKQKIMLSLLGDTKKEIWSTQLSSTAGGT